MTGRLRSSPRAPRTARLFSSAAAGASAGSRRLARLAALAWLAPALLAPAAVAQRGDTSGGSTGRRTDPSVEPAPARRTDPAAPDRRAPAPVEPTERRDVPEVGSEGRRTDTGRSDAGRTDTGRSDAGRSRTPVVPAEPVRGSGAPADPGRSRGDTGRGDAGQGAEPGRRDTGRGDVGRSGDTGRPADPWRPADPGRTGEGARRGDTGRSDTGRSDVGPGRSGAVAVPQASAGAWSTPDWDRWGRDRGDRYDDRYGDRYRTRRPASHIDVVWPWETRSRRAWSPRYRYRQVVYAESGWRGRGWESRYEVVTTYRQRILDASSSRARLELLLDDVAVYQDGRYAGRVTRFPYDFERVRATLYRGGRVDFDRDLMVIGDLREGFELVSTRAYGGYAYSRWRRGDDVRAAWLDFRRGTASFAGRSRFFDPYDYAGYAPISILPADADWLGDYGVYSASAYPYVGYGYDGGWNSGGRDLDDDYYYGHGDVRERRDAAPRGATDGSDRRYDPRSTAGRGSAASEGPALRRDSDDRYTTPGGATIRLRRESEIQRVE